MTFFLLVWFIVLFVSGQWLYFSPKLTGKDVYSMFFPESFFILEAYLMLKCLTEVQVSFLQETNAQADTHPCSSCLESVQFISINVAGLQENLGVSVSGRWAQGKLINKTHQMTDVFYYLQVPEDEGKRALTHCVLQQRVVTQTKTARVLWGEAFPGQF